MKVFDLDKETNTPILRAEFYEIECFKKLQHRINKTKGDSDGRLKLLNRKELSYVYFRGYLGSTYHRYGSEEREEKIKTLLNLPNNWRPDEVVIQCLNVYDELQETTSRDLYISLDTMVQALTKYCTDRTKEIINGKSSLKPKEIKDLMDVSEKTPKLMENIRLAKIQLEKEHSEVGTGRKGRQLNKFELPD